MYETQLFAGWGDMDFNAHMRNTAFLDKSATVRMMFFAENGFTMPEFARRRFGPIVRKDVIEYFREVHLLESIRVTLQIAGMSDDGSRFQMRNEFWRANDQLAAKVESVGGWLDLQQRKLMTPPPELLEAMHGLTRTADFREMKSSIKG